MTTNVKANYDRYLWTNQSETAIWRENREVIVHKTYWQRLVDLVWN